MSRKPKVGMLICLKRPEWWAVVRRDHDGWYAAWVSAGRVKRTSSGLTSGISDGGLSGSWHVLGDEGCPEFPLDMLLSRELSDLEKLRVLHLLERINRVEKRGPGWHTPPVSEDEMSARPPSFDE